jgi:hypothetical protein
MSGLEYAEMLERNLFEFVKFHQVNMHTETFKQFIQEAFDAGRRVEKEPS